MNVSPSLYRRHRFPAEIISHCVWLYFRFSLSFRDVEEIMAVRGVTLTYETIRHWCRKFGQTYANGLRRRTPRPGDRWHMDEVFIRVNGRTHYLWRAVDQEGEVLDILVQSRRDRKAAKRFFRKLLDQQEGSCDKTQQAHSILALKRLGIADFCQNRKISNAISLLSSSVHLVAYSKCQCQTLKRKLFRDWKPKIESLLGSYRSVPPVRP